MTDETAALREALIEVIVWHNEQAKKHRGAQAECIVSHRVDEADLHGVDARGHEEAASRLRAILSPPPLVIEPGRWYRTRDGRKALMGECGYAIVYPLGGPRGEPELINYPRRGGRVYTHINLDLDIVAPWEDADNAA